MGKNTLILALEELTSHLRQVLTILFCSVDDWESKQAGWQETIKVLTHMSENVQDLVKDKFVGNYKIMARINQDPKACYIAVRIASFSFIPLLWGHFHWFN